MSWKTIRRETGLIEHVCQEHGCGHPNSGSIVRLDEEGPVGCIGSWNIHGCCGCCGSDDFPGQPKQTIMWALEQYIIKAPENLSGIAKALQPWPLLYYGFKALAKEANNATDSKEG